MYLVNGAGKRIGPYESYIEIALTGNTSMVETKDKGLSILYDVDNAEVDIFLFDNLVEKYFIELSSDMVEPIKKFLSLYSEHYGGI